MSAKELRKRWENAAALADSMLSKLEDAFEDLKEIQGEMEEADMDTEALNLELDLTEVRDLVDNVKAVNA